GLMTKTRCSMTDLECGSCEVSPQVARRPGALDLGVPPRGNCRPLKGKSNVNLGAHLGLCAQRTKTRTCDLSLWACYTYSKHHWLDPRFQPEPSNPSLRAERVAAVSAGAWPIAVPKSVLSTDHGDPLLIVSVSLSCENSHR